MKIKNTKVLVTGACGFIGSHLVETMLEAGADVRAFVYYNSFNSWGWLDSLDKRKLKNIEIVAGDIRDPNFVRRSVKGTDLICHLAALIAIPFSYHAPESYIDTNIKGTLNVLQAGMDASVKRILVTSTSEVYGTAIAVPIKETHPLQGQSPYSASKIGADKIAESFYRSFGLPVTIVRPFNTYGPRQSARAVIPTIITQLLDGKKEIHLGSLSPTRDFNFVKDTCGAYLAIANSRETIGQEINIASGEEISVGDLAKLIMKKTGLNARITTDEKRMRPKKSEVERLLGDNVKIRAMTGWKSEYTLEKGLDLTIKWFSDKENRKLYKSGIYNT